MRAMVLDVPGSPLRAAEVAVPEAGPGQMLIAVQACAVCRTDLHIVDGELPQPKLPLIPGHEIVGTRRCARGRRRALRHRRRASACRGSAGPAAAAATAARPREPLRRRPLHRLRPRRRLRRVRRRRRALLLSHCRRAIRRSAGRAAALRRADRLPRAAHGRRRRARSASTASARRPTSSTQVARYQGREVYAFTRPGDTRGAAVRARARRGLGRRLATRHPPAQLDAAIIFAPVGALVPAALRRRGQGRRGRLRRHPHERHPGVSLRAPLGRARACARSPT